MEKTTLSSPPAIIALSAIGLTALASGINQIPNNKPLTQEEKDGSEVYQLTETMREATNGALSIFTGEWDKSTPREPSSVVILSWEDYHNSETTPYDIMSVSGNTLYLREQKDSSKCISVSFQIENESTTIASIECSNYQDDLQN